MLKCSIKCKNKKLAKDLWSHKNCVFHICLLPFHLFILISLWTLRVSFSFITLFLSSTQRTLTYFVRGCITVHLTSCLTCLDSTEVENLYEIQHKQSSWIQTSQTGVYPYSDNSPYKVSECSLFYILLSLSLSLSLLCSSLKCFVSVCLGVLSSVSCKLLGWQNEWFWALLCFGLHRNVEPRLVGR